MSGYDSYRLSSDTSPEAEKLLFDLLAKKSAAEKLNMVAQMNAAVQTLTMSGLRERHPNESDGQLKVRLAQLLYGREIADEIAARLKNRDNCKRELNPG